VRADPISRPNEPFPAWLHNDCVIDPSEDPGHEQEWKKARQIEDPNEFHVDFLLLTGRGILVVDLRDVQGNIFGGDQMAEWTVFDGPRRFTFTNPQSSLYDRIAAVRAVAGEVPVEGRIVFTRRGRFPKGLPKWTLMVDSLRAEFPAAEHYSGTDNRFTEQWQKLKSAVTPSYMAHMR